MPYVQLNDAQALRTNDRPAYQEEDVCWSGAPMCKPCMSIHYAGWCVSTSARVRMFKECTAEYYTTFRIIREKNGECVYGVVVKS